MKVHALLYHDVLEAGDPDDSGLTGAGARVYKLDASHFRDHLDAIARRVSSPPLRAPDILGSSAPLTGWILTFDDGGLSALRPTAHLLDERGWTGHFFVTAGRIGTPGFLTEAGIRELAARGHLVGSHSWSHPARFSTLTPERMRDEWERSVGRIASIIGQPVLTASVPGGYYSPAVAEAAASAGVRLLFNSEPVSRPARRFGCLVLGRFAITRATTPRLAARLAAGDTPPRAAQWLGWNGRKALKRIGGDLYITAREAVLARRRHA